MTLPGPPVCPSPECPDYGKPLVLIAIWQGLWAFKGEAWVCKGAGCKTEVKP